jgi:hypothetical protein
MIDADAALVDYFGQMLNSASSAGWDWELRVKHDYIANDYVRVYAFGNKINSVLCFVDAGNGMLSVVPFESAAGIWCKYDLTNHDSVKKLVAQQLNRYFHWRVD